MANVIADAVVPVILQGQAQGRVSAGTGLTNSAAPYIVYQRTDFNEWRDLDGPTGVAEVTIQVDCIHTSALQAQLLFERARQFLSDYSGDVACSIGEETFTVRVLNIVALGGLGIAEQTEDPKLFRASGTFLITHHQQGV